MAALVNTKLCTRDLNGLVCTESVRRFWWLLAPMLTYTSPEQWIEPEDVKGEGWGGSVFFYFFFLAVVGVSVAYYCPPYVHICIYTFKNVDFHSDKMLKQFSRPNLSFGLLVLFLVFFHNFTIMVRKYYGVRDCFDLCRFIIISSPFYVIMTNKWLLVGCLWIAIITSHLKGGPVWDRCG